MKHFHPFKPVIISHLTIVYYVVKGFISLKKRLFCLFLATSHIFYPIHTTDITLDFYHECDDAERRKPNERRREKNAIMMMLMGFCIHLRFVKCCVLVVYCIVKLRIFYRHLVRTPNRDRIVKLCCPWIIFRNFQHHQFWIN